MGVLVNIEMLDEMRTRGRERYAAHIKRITDAGLPYPMEVAVVDAITSTSEAYMANLRCLHQPGAAIGHVATAQQLFQDIMAELATAVAEEMRRFGS